MKKIGFMLLVAAFSLLAFSPPVLAKPVDQATKDLLKTLHRQLAHTKDKQDRQDLKQEIKDIKASAHI